MTMLAVAAVTAGLVAIVLVLLDALETIVIPRTVRRRVRITAVYYGIGWNAWAAMMRRMKDSERRTFYLAAYPATSLIGLIALWASGLVLGFALVDWGTATLEGARVSFGDALYMSGVTFFTLGYGDVTPSTPWARAAAVLEAAVGFGFLAILIAYVPVLYQAYSRREVPILLLDRRAGSNPSGGELLGRHAAAGVPQKLTENLREWEVWSAQHLETFLSYPVLAYYRSPHDNQSWLCALAAVLDGCALVHALDLPDEPWARELRFQADATLAMGRHLIVDLAYILDVPPNPSAPSRLSDYEWEILRSGLEGVGLRFVSDARAVVDRWSGLYEPYLVGLARDMFFTLPAWRGDPEAVDNYETTAWEAPRHF